MKKVLFLCDRNYYLSKMSRVRFHSMEAISKVTDFKWSGPGWDGYNNELSVQENIDSLYDKESKPDLVVGYKPLELVDFASVEQKTCIRYNEMYDHEWTLKEINETKPNIIVCHHLNDMKEYEELFKNNPLDFDTKLVNIPHSAEKSIFYDQDNPRPFDFMLVGALGVKTMLGDHYPLRTRMAGILQTLSERGHQCAIVRHPGGDHNDAHTDRYAKDFADVLNKTKIAITCSGAPNSRYGKYIEIPMCNTAIAGDIPGEDQIRLKTFVIEINMDMTDQEIMDKLVFFKQNRTQRKMNVRLGSLWADQFTQEKYAERFVNMLGEL
jgi:hypothetical protein